MRARPSYRDDETYPVDENPRRDRLFHLVDKIRFLVALVNGSHSRFHPPQKVPLCRSQFMTSSIQAPAPVSVTLRLEKSSTEKAMNRFDGKAVQEDITQAQEKDAGRRKMERQEREQIEDRGFRTAESHSRRKSTEYQPASGGDYPPGTPGGPPPSQPQSENGRPYAPNCFSRPPSAARSYTQFETVKIQDMDDLVKVIPRMPAVLTTHDVH